MTKEFCRHCGADALEGAQNCAVCGARLDAATSDALPQETAQRAAVASGPTSPSAPPAPSAAPPPPAQYAPYPSAPGVWAPPAQSPYPAYPGYPGYPGYPMQPAQPGQQGQPDYQPYPYGAGYPQPGQTYGYPMGGYYPPQYAMQPAPRRAPGEVYALVISWIATVASALAILGGLLVTALATLGVFSGQGDDLSYLGGIIGFSLAPIVGGAFGLWYGILGIRRRPSPRFGLPAAWLILALAVLAIGGGVALWQYNFTQMRSPGTAFGILPLAMLTGTLPALTILAFTTQQDWLCSLVQRLPPDQLCLRTAAFRRLCRPGERHRISVPGALHASAPSLFQRFEVLRTTLHWSHGKRARNSIFRVFRQSASAVKRSQAQTPQFACLRCPLRRVLTFSRIARVAIR